MRTFLAALIASVLLIVPGAPALAATNDVVNAPVVTTAGATAKAVITGTLSADTVNRMNGTQDQIKFVGGVIKDDGSLDSVSLNVICDQPKNTFVCTVPDLAEGHYYYRVGLLIPPVRDEHGVVEGETFVPFFDAQRDFYVHLDLPAITFGGAAVSGDSVDVTINLLNIPIPSQAFAELGIASQIGQTVKYACAAGGQTSTPNPTSVPAVGTVPTPVHFQFTGVPDGNYCVRVHVKIPGGTSSYIVVPATNSEGFFTDRSALFSVGAATLVPGATINTNANANGCVTNGDNTNYCMLAPLPGVGDETGSINVSTQFNQYLNTIITFFFGAIGVLSVLMIVIGGIEYMSTTIAGEKEGAKSRITNAIFGLLLALSAYLILKTINPKLVDGGITIPQVTVTLDPDTFTPTSGGGVAVGGGSNPNVTSNITTYDSMLKTAAASNPGVECTLLKAFMYAESGGNPNAVSNVGAHGLMQLMPDTFAGLGFDASQIDDPQQSINAGAKYIRSLLTTACNGTTSNSVCNVNDLKYVVAAYNGGPKANGYSEVCKKGQNIDTTAWQCTLNVKGYAQTRAYVTRVLANRDKLIQIGGGC